MEKMTESNWQLKLTEVLDDILKSETNVQKIHDIIMKELNIYRKNNPVPKKAIVYDPEYVEPRFNSLFEKNLEINKISITDDQKLANFLLDFGEDIYNNNWHYVQLACIADFYDKECRYGRNLNNNKLISYFNGKFNQESYDQKYLNAMIKETFGQNGKHCQSKNYPWMMSIPQKYLTGFTIKQPIDKNKSTNLPKKGKLSFSDIVDPNYKKTFNIYYRKYIRNDTIYMIDPQGQKFIDEFQSIIENEIHKNCDETFSKKDNWYDPIEKKIHVITPELKQKLIEKFAIIAANSNGKYLSVKWIPIDAPYHVKQYDEYAKVEIISAKCKF